MGANYLDSMSMGRVPFQLPDYTQMGIGTVAPLQREVDSGFGTTGDKIGLGLQGIQTLAGLFMGLKQLGLANKQFNFQKQFATTNLANSVKSYNTALSDRLRARSVMETGSTAGSEAGIAANSLKTSYPS